MKMCDVLFGLFEGVLLGIALSALCIGVFGRDYRQEAIEAGVAEYVITDPTNSQGEFRWIKPHTQEKE